MRRPVIRSTTRDRAGTLAELSESLPPVVRANAYVSRALEALASLNIEEKQRQIKALNVEAVSKPYLHAVAGHESKIFTYYDIIRDVGSFPETIGALYLHFPYCVKKCRFCHYYTDSSGTYEDWDLFPQFLVRELALLRQAYDHSSPVSADTIHFGGGTPSLIPPACWVTFVDRLREHVAFDDASEVAIEVDPEDVEAAKIDAWLSVGIDRASLGVQSFDDYVLTHLRRGHDRAKAIGAVRFLQQAGVKNINVDLMYGMPSRPFASWLDDLEFVVDLRPDSITCYATRPNPTNDTERTTDFPSDASRLLAHRVAIELLMERGYIQYAPNQFISGYEGACKAKNNRNRCLDVMGVGPRAHSIFQGWFYETTATLRTYRAVVARGQLCDVKATKLSDRETRIRFLQFGIKLSGLEKPRDDNGVPAGQYRALFGVDVHHDFGPELATLSRLGLLETDAEGAIRLTPSGVLLAHEVVKHFGLAHAPN